MAWGAATLSTARVHVSATQNRGRRLPRDAAYTEMSWMLEFVFVFVFPLNRRMLAWSAWALMRPSDSHARRYTPVNDPGFVRRS